MFLDVFVTGSLLWRIQGFRRGTLPHTISLVRRLIVLVRFFSGSLKHVADPAMQSFSTCLVVTLTQAASLVMFYQIALSTSTGLLGRKELISATGTACPTLQTIVRLQILSVLAHLASRPTKGPFGTSQCPSFISFGASTDDSNQQRVGAFFGDSANSHSKNRLLHLFTFNHREKSRRRPQATTTVYAVSMPDKAASSNAEL
jgi:hypothetical protein